MKCSIFKWGKNPSKDDLCLIKKVKSQTVFSHEWKMDRTKPTFMLYLLRHKTSLFWASTNGQEGVLLSTIIHGWIADPVHSFPFIHKFILEEEVMMGTPRIRKWGLIYDLWPNHLQQWTNSTDFGSLKCCRFLKINGGFFRFSEGTFL